VIASKYERTIGATEAMKSKREACLIIWTDVQNYCN